MQTCAARYALTHVTALKLLLVSWTVIHVGQTAAEFKLGFSLSNNTYIRIYMV
jgi:hypothetical protein